MKVIARLAFAGLALLPVASSAAAAQDAAACALQPNTLTHSQPPYPPISWRVNEQGATMMAVAVGMDGVPADVTVTRSSGSERLDTAAIRHIRAYWRWQPPTEDCKPVTALALVVVDWHVDMPSESKAGPQIPKTDFPPGAEIMSVTVPHIQTVE